MFPCHQPARNPFRLLEASCSSFRGPLSQKSKTQNFTQVKTPCASNLSLCALRPAGETAFKGRLACVIFSSSQLGHRTQTKSRCTIPHLHVPRVMQDVYTQGHLRIPPTRPAKARFLPIVQFRGKSTVIRTQCGEERPSAPNVDADPSLARLRAPALFPSARCSGSPTQSGKQRLILSMQRRRKDFIPSCVSSWARLYRLFSSFSANRQPHGSPVINARTDAQLHELVRRMRRRTALYRRRLEEGDACSLEASTGAGERGPPGGDVRLVKVLVWVPQKQTRR